MEEQMTVGTAALPGQPALAAMLTRELADSTNREAWLEARRTRVTATEAKKLAAGSAAARRAILEEKLHPETVADLSGNRYVQRGNDREPHITDWMAAKWPGLTHNTVLYAGAEHPRHAATPDAVGILDGVFVLGEVKTSKYDLHPGIPGGHFWSMGYWEQCQWQMYVAGARRLLFVWEQHDGNWPNPEPLDLEPQYVWISYRPDVVAKMTAQADLLLAELDQELQKLQPAPHGSSAVVQGVTVADSAHISGGIRQEADILGVTVLEARKAESEAKARKDTAWKRLQTLLADQPSFTNPGLSRVTWSNEVTTARVPDQDAALAAEGGQELYDAFQAARLAWDEHQGKFWQDRKTSAQKLTVTDPARKGSKRA